MQTIYKILISVLGPFLPLLLKYRCLKNKEDPDRVHEKKGIPSKPRPAGRLIWIHAASVGESQSALILITHILEQKPETHILVTTGTKTSAELMDKRLPSNAFHQYYPLDHPAYIQKFLDHWKPDAALWMESELWPNMLDALRKREIKSVLVNARLSEKSFKRWKKNKTFAKNILSTFYKILCQTEKEKSHFDYFLPRKAIAAGNIKFSALPLTYDEQELLKLQNLLQDQPFWIYASTHNGEEELACEIHQEIVRTIPDLLTIIIPRHPDRAESIKKSIERYNLDVTFRTNTLFLPRLQDDIYIADTLGELGLFYKLSPVVCIGRSFSKDGGGGHNPIEAAQLNCAILTGPNVQNLQEIYDGMVEEKVIQQVETKEEFIEKLIHLLKNPTVQAYWQYRALDYVKKRRNVIEKIIKEIEPLI
ncbi:MAG: 3-deoxy-D-manno-octulosonic acid transferase [Alphaproteobacteria bacterium]|nr:3-deoxy-D-manno-octulosonic acid transferase [Alphaproteobacteria bacterium]